MTYMRRARIRRTIKLFLMLIIAASVYGLARFHYNTAVYVTTRHMQVQAIEHGAGIFDMRPGSGGRFLWWDDIIRMRDEALKRQFLEQHHKPGPDKPAILQFLPPVPYRASHHQQYNA